MYYAHSTSGDRSHWQKLIDHLHHTALLAKGLGEKIGLGQYSYIAALYHDIGKYSEEFQKRLAGGKLIVDHSTAGAKEIANIFSSTPAEKIVGQMLSYCIAGHHSGLLDCGSPYDVETDGTWDARMKKQIPDYGTFRSEIKTSGFSLPEHLPIKPTTKKGSFSLSFLTRMIYSILVDADFLETETFMKSGGISRGQFDSISTLNERLNSYLEQFKNPTTSLNRKRTETLLLAIEKANSARGIFTLTVPTGGGKTLTSMAFALNHARQNGLERIIYVIPYTTIIDQNATVFKHCLGEENILEHHSNFDWEGALKSDSPDSEDDQTNNAINKLKLSSENWDVPVIVTTNVQFFESLFNNRSSRCRKIHNMANSVLVFDEAQMLPREFLDPCMKAVCELVKNYQSTAVFCTATQPILKKFFPTNIVFDEISKDPINLYQTYKRTYIIYDGKQPDAAIVESINQINQVLCIVNTRKHAKGLFKSLQMEGRYHLSTLMCAAHRKKTIGMIRERLASRQTCRVISTQIMEAGIDIDFPIGYRALAGLDSIIQAAGRVNREGKLPFGELHVFEPVSEFIKRTPAYIAQAAAVAQNILRQFKDDPLCLEAIQSYYNTLYSIQEPNAFDEKQILSCFEQGNPGEINFNFRSAAEKFRLIDEKTRSVIIPFDETVQQILKNEVLLNEPYRLLRKLQPYTVNLFEQEYFNLEGKGVIGFINDRFPVLRDRGFYDDETGLSLPETTGGEAIFFDRKGG